VSAESNDGKAGSVATSRADDDIHRSLADAIRTCLKSQKTTMDWLNEQQVPMIKLDGPNALPKGD
jgi:hypothetical protein